MLGISEFAVCVRHGCDLEATVSNSELDFTFFLLVSETSVTRNAAPLCALVGKERIIRKTALLLEVSALSVHL